MPQLMMLILAATLGRAPAPAGDGWLDAVPAEADVVLHVRGAEPVRKDLAAMIDAMSPALGQQAGPALEQLLAQMKGLYGDEAVARPFLALLRVAQREAQAAGEGQAVPPYAIIVKSGTYEEFLKSVAGGMDPKIAHQDAGYDSFDGPAGNTWYAAKGDGTVAFGIDKALIAGIARPGATSLGKTLAPALRARLTGGDVGLYVNIKALTARYAEPIDRARQGLMGVMDQAGQQAGNAAAMEIAKGMYAGMFDSLKEADALALNFDFAAEGLSVGGELMVKADSKVVKRIAGATPGDPSAVAKLPADAAFFAYMNLDPATYGAVLKMSLRMMSPGGKPSPELEAAFAPFGRLGRIETSGSMTFGPGMSMFNVTNASDPKAVLAATEASTRAMKGADSPFNVYKDITFTPAAETYAGFTFARAEMTLDPEKLAKMQAGNPAAGASLKAMFGGDKFTSWYGINDSQMLQITAPNWDAAKARIDAYREGKGTLGATGGFRAVRSKLPDGVNMLMLLSAQGLVRQILAQVGPDFGLPKPVGLPNDPALIGVSLTTRPPAGFEVHLVVPSPVVGVFEKNLAPIIQNVRAAAPRPQ